jgi:hypothetical protein
LSAKKAPIRALESAVAERTEKLQLCLKIESISATSKQRRAMRFCAEAKERELTSSPLPSKVRGFRISMRILTK